MQVDTAGIVIGSIVFRVGPPVGLQQMGGRQQHCQYMQPLVASHSFSEDPTYAAMHPWYHVITDLQKDNLAAGEASIAPGCRVAVIDLNQGLRSNTAVPAAAAANTSITPIIFLFAADVASICVPFVLQDQTAALHLQLPRRLSFFAIASHPTVRFGTQVGTDSW